MKIVIDTSVFIDYSRAKVGYYPKLLEMANKGKGDLYTSTVVIAEFWSGKSMSLSTERKFAEKLFSGIKRIDLNEEIAQLAGELTRKNGLSGFDAMIAASALYENAVLATSNKKHFTKVKDLRIFED